MLIVLLTGAGLGFIQRVHRQCHAVAAIRRAGGEVYYDWECPDGRPAVTRHRSSGPIGFGTVFGPDVLSNPAAVRLWKGGGLAYDGLMAEVGELGRLQYLVISGAPVTDVGMAALRRLTRLKTLRLYTGSVSGACLIHLKQMTELEELELPYTPGSDDDLVHIAAIRKLKLLRLDGTRITNAGLAHLAHMSQMEVLGLRNAAITSLESLRGMTHLKSLDLDGSSVGDAAMEIVASFRNLQEVRLSKTRITDTALGNVCALPELRFLDLHGTSIHNSSIPRLCGLRVISTLNLADTELTNSGLLELADKLRSTPCRTLVVGGLGVTSECVQSLRLKLPEVTVLIPESPPQRPTSDARSYERSLGSETGTRTVLCANTNRVPVSVPGFLAFPSFGAARVSTSLWAELT
jgi:hypothetical protein